MSNPILILKFFFKSLVYILLTIAGLALFMWGLDALDRKFTSDVTMLILLLAMTLYTVWRSREVGFREFLQSTWIAKTPTGRFAEVICLLLAFPYLFVKDSLLSAMPQMDTWQAVRFYLDYSLYGGLVVVAVVAGVFLVVNIWKRAISPRLTARRD